LRGEEANAARGMSWGMDNLETSQWLKYLPTPQLNVNLVGIYGEEGT